MEEYNQVIAALENQIAKCSKTSNKLLEQLEFAIGHCTVALQNLRELVVDREFENIQAEIFFFKHIKPYVNSQLLYYRSVFKIESSRPTGNKDSLKQYYRLELDKIHHYMEEQSDMVQYCRCNFDYLDEKYFTRKYAEIPVQLRNYHSLVDEAFFTWQDQTFARIKANEMLVEYLSQELGKLENPENNQSKQQSTNNWTGSKVALVELIYALYYSGMVKGGSAGIKDLAETFEQAFNIDLKDYYRAFTEIKQRKIERTKFLDFLRSTLENKLQESDR